MYIYMIPIVVTPNFTPALAASPCYVFFFFSSSFFLPHRRLKRAKDKGAGGGGRRKRSSTHWNLHSFFSPFLLPHPLGRLLLALTKKAHGLVVVMKRRHTCDPSGRV